MPGIVVGVDGSPNSEHALDWAMRQAAAVHSPLTVIAVHEVAKSYWGGIPVIGPADAPLLEKLRCDGVDHQLRGDGMAACCGRGRAHCGTGSADAVVGPGGADRRQVCC
jgi:nucleotide-binding universal stress UspA family protein